MKKYRDLKVWQRSHELTLAVSHTTETFPKDELYSLTSQMRRAAASIPTNIAEGCARDGDPELKRFLNIALGSACELDYPTLLARDLRYLEDDEWKRLASEAIQIRRMLGIVSGHR